MAVGFENPSSQAEDHLERERDNDHTLRIHFCTPHGILSILLHFRNYLKEQTPQMLRYMSYLQRSSWLSPQKGIK